MRPGATANDQAVEPDHRSYPAGGRCAHLRHRRVTLTAVGGRPGSEAAAAASSAYAPDWSAQASVTGSAAHLTDWAAIQASGGGVGSTSWSVRRHALYH